MPANGVGVRVHDVWLVNAAVNAEAELVVVDAAAPGTSLRVIYRKTWPLRGGGHLAR